MAVDAGSLLEFEFLSIFILTYGGGGDPCV